MELYSKDRETQLTSTYIISDIVILLKYMYEWTLQFINVSPSTYKCELYLELDLWLASRY